MTTPRSRFIGMDEAGYGPNLGPLVIVATSWTTPGAAASTEFYKLLRKAVSANSDGGGRRLHIADSKTVYSPQTGLESLELSALGLLRAAGVGCDSYCELISALEPQACEHRPRHPWYSGSDLQLPLVADRVRVERLSWRFRKELEAGDMSLAQIRAAVVEPGRFNAALVDGNKAELLSRTAFRLLSSVWDPNDGIDTVVVGDKHGGRNRYDQLLAEILAGEMIFRVEEHRDISRYRVNRTELRFQTRGEQHFPVAAASIIAKYLRELSMELFNQYWTRHVPGLKPTKGYPDDARRFREDVAKKLVELAIDERVFWRER